MSRDDEALRLHAEHRGKLRVEAAIPLHDAGDLALAYTPGVAAVSSAIARDRAKVWDYTIKPHTVAVVTDGSAVLGLGNIGPEAALPVMEGKCVLFKTMAGIDAIPLCVATQDPDEIVRIVRAIVPVFGGINLEDIAAPHCFAIEAALQGLGIPVMHDDQHATAIVVQAALMNACRVTGKKLEDLTVVVNGAGAAGIAVAKMLRCINVSERLCTSVRDVIVCDSRGIIARDRHGLTSYKRELAEQTNHAHRTGSLADAMIDADVFVGVSVANAVSESMVRSMAPNPIMFAMANPIPEIMPDAALRAGAAVVGTGRSDFPNQINNALAFPGVFKGALDAKATIISNEMKAAAARALAGAIEPIAEKILPAVLDDGYVDSIARAVAKEAIETGKIRQ